MFFYSIIKPFRYPYCLIFSLPDNENYKPIFDCPIPFLIGINSCNIEIKNNNAIYVDINKN